MSQVPNRRPPSSGVSANHVTAFELSEKPLQPPPPAPSTSGASFISPPDLSNLKDCPLPEGWDVGLDFDGKPYFIDHKNKNTTWVDPRDR